MRVSLVQMEVAWGNPDKNKKIVEERVREAVAEGAEVILLPELWNTGYDLTHLEELADEGEVKSWLASLARQQRITLVAGSIAEKQRGQIYNTSYTFNSLGSLINTYRKVHLFRLMEEEQYLEAGNTRTLFQLGELKAGTAICYDIRFPEFIRSYALDGAELLFVPAEWPHPRLQHWRVLNQARAIENQMFVIAANRVGAGGGTRFCGHSMVIDPWGNIIAEAGEGEEVLTVDIDISEVARVREMIPVYEDRMVIYYRL
ncbi:carbon-nitrogen family hydrolase [Mechercharimyces sp. CAU 1602]|uniref:carbon-nitrogen family hydrolase n=1 Tax=Mechercharimyces sp. CAU 1602 TaxID=2973933 RepID=UPI0021638881|nr:carbon-nitrogen family hydrolase [Mechercharimyces sp. CAU 1602]MCS1350696.1 carbon-nitrogen family hydrolase [Mechercharimyces sp. CAU 1602]